MDSFTKRMILIIGGTILFFVGFVAFIIYSPTSTGDYYGENHIYCRKEKGWSFGSTKKTCFGLYELNVDPKIHFELQEAVKGANLK